VPFILEAMIVPAGHGQVGADGGPAFGEADPMVHVGLPSRRPTARVHALAISLLHPAAQDRARSSPIGIAGVGVRILRPELNVLGVLGVLGQLGQHACPRTRAGRTSAEPANLGNRDRKFDDASAPSIAAHRPTRDGARARSDQAATDRAPVRITQHVPPLGRLHRKHQLAGGSAR
jgi:hypothetical protein